MDRGVSGELVRTPGEYVEKDLFPARYVSLDSDGFPFSTQTSNGHSRLPQPKGFDLGPWRKEKGILHNAEILSGARSNITEVDRGSVKALSILPKNKNKNR